MVTCVLAMFDWKFVLWCLENFRFFFPIPPTHKVLPRNGTHPTQNLTRNLTKKIQCKKMFSDAVISKKPSKIDPKLPKFLQRPSLLHKIVDKIHRWLLNLSSISRDIFFVFFVQNYQGRCSADLKIFGKILIFAFFGSAISPTYYKFPITYTSWTQHFTRDSIK